MATGSNKAVIAALIANLGIAVAKFVGFALTGASSMLAEAIHSCADSGNQGLLLLGSSRGKRGASEEHPFGYGRERYFWAFVVALVIFALGSVFAIYEGVHKLMRPGELTSPIIAVAILFAAICLEGWSFRTAIKEAIPLKGDRSWYEFVHRTKEAELPVVLMEDFGALIGLVLALIGVGLSVLTGDARFDAIGSIAIGILLGVIAIVLAVEMKSLLIGESANLPTQGKIREALESAPDVVRVIHMRTLHLAPEELLVSAKIELSGNLSFSEVTDAINRAEDAIRAAVPIAHLVYLEPDLFRGSETELTSRSVSPP